MSEEQATLGPDDFTKEQLERIELFNRIQFAKLVFEDEDIHRRSINELIAEQAETSKKTSDIMLTGTRENLRPHQMYHSEVYYCPSEKKYCCRLPFEDPADEDGISIVAYGDTPAAACDNFDHKWIHGDS